MADSRDWTPANPATGADVLSALTRDNMQAIDDAIFAAISGIDGGYIRGFLPQRTGADTIQVSPGIVWSDSTKRLRRKTTATTIDITTSGAGGLDTGSVAADTLYYIWLLYNNTSGDVDFMFSTSPASPTVPGGYTAARVIDCWFRGDATTGLKPGYTIGMGRDRKRIWTGDFGDPSADSLWSLAAGNATTYTGVDYSVHGGIPPADVSDALWIFPSVVDLVGYKDDVSQNRKCYLAHNSGPVSGDSRIMLFIKNYAHTVMQNFLFLEKTVKYKLDGTSCDLYLGVFAYTFHI